MVRAKITAKSEEVDLHVPQCVIQGTDTTAGEIIFTAHLYEGYVKMGANDNASGSAVLLEVAHLLNDLIKEGKIEKPKRNIRFLWVPEFSGTIPWVNAHKELVKKALCNINLDMVGLRLFLGRPSRDFSSVKEANLSMMTPLIVLAGTCVVFGVLAFMIPLPALIIPAASQSIIYSGLWHPLAATSFLIMGLVAGLAGYWFNRSVNSVQ